METNGILKNKKILYIHRDGQGWGGAQQGVIDLIEHFKTEFGAAVFVGNKGQLLQRARQNGTKCYKLPFHRVLMFPVSFLLLAVVLKKESPDIVHSNHRYTSVLVQLVRKIIRGKFTTLHTARSVFYSKTHLNDLGDRIVAISDTAKKNIVEQFNYPPEKIDIIYNGIEIEKNKNHGGKIQQLENVNLSNKAIIGIIGGLVESKGHHYLFQAIAKLPGELKNRTIVLVSGQGHLVEELKLLARTLNIAEMVKFLGYCKEIVPVLNKCDFLVIPSIQEGGSRVLIEGFLSGIPSIAFGLQFAYEFIQHNQTGLIVPVRDVDALAKAVQVYIEHPEIAQKHGRNGKRFVNGKFTKKRMYDRYCAVYQKILVSSQ